jgi:SAM-dependent methyltransferase
MGKRHADVKSFQARASSDAVVRYNRETYDRFWKYGHYKRPRTFPCWPMMRDLAARAPRRLEIGPGIWPRLPVRGTHVLDLSTRALSLLEARGAIPHVGLLEDSSFDDASFDLVSMFEVMEHVSDDAAFLAEVARILRPGGRLAMSTPLHMKNHTHWDDYSGHVRRYEPPELVEKLTRAGFRIDSFAVHEGMTGRSARAGSLFVIWFVDHFPWAAFWLTERLLMPIDGLAPFTWRNPSEWESATAKCIDSTLICSRMAGNEPDRDLEAGELPRQPHPAA